MSVLERAELRHEHGPADSLRPLVIDLDGTLVRTDLLVETAFGELGRRPQSIFAMLRALLRGKAHLKAYLAGNLDLDPATLPYDAAVLDLIGDARAEGRRVYLASASNERIVAAVAGHLGLFDGWFGSTAAKNLAGENKAAALVQAFGERGFDYLGNGRADLLVWAHAHACHGVRVAPRLARRLGHREPPISLLPADRASLRPWIKLLRPHQYAKNALVFVPLLTAHQFGLGSIAAAIIAFAAFSLCASAVYVINDLVDIQADRAHPTKRRRPLAAGTVPIVPAMVLAPLLLVAGALIAVAVSLPFAGVLLCYFLLTTAYSFYLKRRMLVDVVALALLYTVRVVGGAVAVGVVASEWLLAFAVLVFTALALIKRYIELAARLDRGMADPTNRNYRISDLPVIAAMAAAAGLNAVTVWSLYISSDAVAGLYSRPLLLWLVSPALLYWVMRMLLLAHRRAIDDDPVVFALHDRNSFIVLCFIGCVVLAAI